MVNVPRDVAEFIATRVMKGVEAPPEMLESAIREIEVAVRDRFATPQPPHVGETVAVTFASPKTAALYFDRVWESPASIDKAPPTVGVWGASEFEIWSQVAMLGAESEFWNEPEIANDLVQLWADAARLAPVERAIADNLTSTFGLPAIPVYQTQGTRDEQYRPGRTDLIVASVSELELVDEAQLTWEQVLEFRRDRETRAKYRRFVHWLDSELVGRSQSFITDEVAARMRDYEWSLRKHGIKTALGSLSALLDPAFLAGTSLAVTSAAIAGNGQIAAITGLCVTCGRALVTIGSSLVDLADERRKASEIAFVYEIAAARL